MQSRLSSLWWERSGVLGWWLNLTASPRPSDMSSRKTREFVRRSELISIVSLMVVAFLLSMVGNSLSDPSTMVACVAMAITNIIALAFNRFGRVNISSTIIVTFMVLVLVVSILGAKGGLRFTWFVTYDLFTIPIFVSALIIHRNAAIVVALLCATFILLDFALAPRYLINVHGYLFDELEWEILQPHFSWWAQIARDFFLLLFAGLFGWLAAYSFERSLDWAEQTKQEALAAYTKAFETEQIAVEKQQVAAMVSQFLNEVITAFTEQANGRTVYLPARSSKDDPLAPYAFMLNERLRRFDQLRKQSDTWSTIQFQQALKALSTTLHKIAIISLPVEAVSPSHFRTGIEAVDEIANQIYILLYHQHHRSSQPPSTPSQPLSPLKPQTYLNHPGSHPSLPL